MNDTVFLVWNKKDYFYDLEPRCMRPAYLCGDVLLSVSRACKRLHKDTVPGFLVRNDIKRAEKIILTDACFDPCLYNTLKRYCRPENIYLYYTNLVDSKNREYMNLFPERVYTFDRADAERFGIIYRHLPYSGKVRIGQKEPKYDTVFLGMEKGRLPGIKKAEGMLKGCGLKAKIMIPYSSDSRYMISSYMQYSEYLAYVEESRSILEINVPGQTGCTLRFLESVFLKKKLITDNPQIVNDPWYEHENVFVLGMDDLNDLPDFISRPYKDKGQDLSEIMFENWIQDW